MLTYFGLVVKLGKISFRNRTAPGIAQSANGLGTIALAEASFLER
jgi:hypothetical protein